MGKTFLMNNLKFVKYNCDCGIDTEYGIYRYINDNEWLIDSCCGGCVAAVNINYCPFCGEKINVD